MNLNDWTSTPLAFAVGLSWILLSTALLLAFVRLLLGPSVPDRVVALDLIATLAVGIIALDAIASNQPVILDVAIVVSLIAFLGTVAFARYLIRGVSR